jgi:putative chitinase
VTLTERLVEQLTGDAARWHAPLNRALNVWKIDTPERVAMFLAQCAHESGGFKRLTESLRYSASALLATWPNRFTPDEAVAMAYNEEAIAERAYGGRMGNGPEGSGDGFLYRGRGIIQLTGRENYRKAGAAIGIDLEAKPDAALQPVAACQVAGWYWSSHGCNELADAGDFEGITRRINGGLNGLADRKAWLSKVRPLLAAEPGTQTAAPIEDKSTEYSPPVGGITEPEKEQTMGAIALPLLAQLIPQVLGLFSQRAQATIAEKTGADPKVAADFMQAMIAQVGHAVGVPVVDGATATQAVAALTAAPPEARATKAAALEQQAIATVDALLKAGDKMADWNERKWAAELTGRKTSSTIAIEEKKAGIWDMTQTVVLFAAITLSVLVFSLLGALIYQAVTGKRTLDSGLLGLSGPIFMAAVAAWGAVIAFRFDGTKESSEQSRALTDAIRERGQS